MNEAMKINDNVTVGPQPTDRELAGLGGLGFQSVINFREAGEQERQTPPETEGNEARLFGLDYLHVPVSLDKLTPQVVDEFRAQFERMPLPAYAHCASGKRAGAMMLMHLGVVNGMSGEETLATAEQMGFECDNEKLKQFVKEYVDTHSE